MNEEIYEVLSCLEQIPIQGKYEGYIWFSDKKKPDIYRKETLKKWDNKSNPFIVEGHLYETLSDISFSIKFVDGLYIIRKYNIKVIKSEYNDFVEDKTFLSNRMNNTWLKFKQLWEKTPDDLCLGMDVYYPSIFAFVGFKE